MGKSVHVLIALAVIAILVSLGAVDGVFAGPLPPPPPAPHPVPGPIVGAGLPIVAVGYGAYWLVRRFRRKVNNSHGPSVRETGTVG
jgi:hypothetical protein